MIPYYYRILEVSPDSPQEEIRRSYRRLAKKWHPDVNRSPEANERFLLIQKAWKTLGDAESRSNYDFYVKRYSHYSGEPGKYVPYTQQTSKSQPEYASHRRWYPPAGYSTATPEEEAKPYTKEWIFIGLIIIFFITIPITSDLWFRFLLNFRHRETVAEVVGMNDGISFFFLGNDQPVTDNFLTELNQVGNEIVIKEGMPVKMGDRFKVIYLPRSPYINKLKLDKPDDETYERYCMAIWMRWQQSDQLMELSAGKMKAVFLFALCDSIFAHYGTRGLADMYFADTHPEINIYSNSETFRILRKQDKFVEIVNGINFTLNPEIR